MSTGQIFTVKLPVYVDPEGTEVAISMVNSDLSLFEFDKIAKEIILKNPEPGEYKV